MHEYENPPNPESSRTTVSKMRGDGAWEQNMVPGKKWGADGFQLVQVTRV
jgi:hypothetical protein